MTLQQLHYVITIAHRHSYRKAAEALYVSQPSLSCAVQELERELGIVIFHRSNKGVSLTAAGADFLSKALALYQQYELLMEPYLKPDKRRRRFAVSAQHYSFATKCFVDVVKELEISEFDLEIKETKTAEVIADVGNLRSEIGILYLDDFNRKFLFKQFAANGLEFHKLIETRAYVYLHRSHPLADREYIVFRDLQDYPCLFFDQGDNQSTYLNEEILSTNDYHKTIRTNDRATMLNLMQGLGGYTLCCGIIDRELNGSDYLAVPFQEDDANKNSVMEIGYIQKKSAVLSALAQQYIEHLRQYLQSC